MERTGSGGERASMVLLLVVGGHTLLAVKRILGAWSDSEEKEKKEEKEEEIEDDGKMKEDRVQRR